MKEERFSEPEITPQELADAEDPDLENETTKTEVIKRMQLIRLKLIAYFSELGVFKKIGNAMDKLSDQIKNMQDKKRVNEYMELYSRQVGIMVKSLNMKAKKIAKLRLKKEREKRGEEE